MITALAEKPEVDFDICVNCVDTNTASAAGICVKISSWIYSSAVLTMDIRFAYDSGS